MIDPDAATRLSGDTVVDADGREVGQVVEVLTDDRTGLPTYAAVDTGLSGRRRAVIPLAHAELMGNRLRIAYEKVVVEATPAVELMPGRLTPEAAAQVDRYYEVRNGDVAQEKFFDATPATTPAVTRSAERLQVGTQRVSRERVRLRKVIVTEQVTVTVPVSREEFRLERELINDGRTGADLATTPVDGVQYEFVLYAERPVVTTEIVPVERVRISTVTVTEQQTLPESLREERIHVDTDADLSSKRG